MFTNEKSSPSKPKSFNGVIEFVRQHEKHDERL
jgi:hypothetical protein